MESNIDLLQINKIEKYDPMGFVINEMFITISWGFNINP